MQARTKRIKIIYFKSEKYKTCANIFLKIVTVSLLLVIWIHFSLVTGICFLVVMPIIYYLNKKDSNRASIDS
jgi:hypothetical protein